MIFDVLHAGRFGSIAVQFVRLAFSVEMLDEMEQQCALFHRAMLDHLDAVARSRYSQYKYTWS